METVHSQINKTCSYMPFVIRAIRFRHVLPLIYPILKLKFQIGFSSSSILSHCWGHSVFVIWNWTSNIWNRASDSNFSSTLYTGWFRLYMKTEFLVNCTSHVWIRSKFRLHRFSLILHRSSNSGQINGFLLL